MKLTVLSGQLQGTISAVTIIHINVYAVVPHELCLTLSMGEPHSSDVSGQVTF